MPNVRAWRTAQVCRSRSDAVRLCTWHLKAEAVMNQDPLLTVKWPQRLHSSVRSTYRSRVEVTQRLLLLDWECANAFLSCRPQYPTVAGEQTLDDFMQKVARRGPDADHRRSGGGKHQRGDGKSRVAAIALPDGATGLGFRRGPWRPPQHYTRVDYRGSTAGKYWRALG
jgi:hypothetical protein